MDVVNEAVIEAAREVAATEYFLEVLRGLNTAYVQALPDPHNITFACDAIAKTMTQAAYEVHNILAGNPPGESWPLEEPISGFANEKSPADDGEALRAITVDASGIEFVDASDDLN